MSNIDYKETTAGISDKTANKTTSKDTHSVIHSFNSSASKDNTIQRNQFVSKIEFFDQPRKYSDYSVKDRKLRFTPKNSSAPKQ